MCAMLFPWPVTDDELTLSEALDIAMRYFDLPPDEEQYADVESVRCRSMADPIRARPRAASGSNSQPGYKSVLHSVVLKGLAACSAKPVTVLLQALLDCAVAIGQLLPAKPRRIARAR
jgi:hypothetical protein